MSNLVPSDMALMHLLYIIFQVFQVLALQVVMVRLDSAIDFQRLMGENELLSFYMWAFGYFDVQEEYQGRCSGIEFKLIASLSPGIKVR